MTPESIPSGALKVAEECKRLAAGVRIAITRQCMDPCAKNVARCDLAGSGLNAAIDQLAALASPTPQATAKCIGSDPLCPCADGDTCHYAGKNPFPIRATGALSDAGAPMANTMFNLAQEPGYVLTDADCKLFKSMQVKWDAALSSAKREAEPLTDAQIALMDEMCSGITEIVRAIETAHGIVAPTLQAAPEEKS